MLGVFLALQLTAGLVLDYVLPYWRNPFPRILLHDIDRRRTTPEILLLGTSRTGCCIDDRLATQRLREQTGDAGVQVFNASFPAADPVAWEPLLERVLERPTLPRLLVLELIPESVTDRSHCVQFHILRQMTWTTVPEHLRAVFATGNLGRLLTARFLPLFAFRDRIGDGVVDLWHHEAEDAPPGSATETYSSVRWNQIIPGGNTAEEIDRRLRVGLHQVDLELSGYVPRGPAREALERSLSRCGAAGVPVVLLGVPLAGPHRERYTPAIQATFAAYVEELKLKFGTTYRDCRDALPDALFTDHNHAASAGQQEFSRNLTDAILALRWREMTR
jgi:hypothetical protein